MMGLDMMAMLQRGCVFSVEGGRLDYWICPQRLKYTGMMVKCRCERLGTDLIVRVERPVWENTVTTLDCFASYYQLTSSGATHVKVYSVRIDWEPGNWAFGIVRGDRKFLCTLDPRHGPPRHRHPDAADAPAAVAAPGAAGPAVEPAAPAAAPPLPPPAEEPADINYIDSSPEEAEKRVQALLGELFAPGDENENDVDDGSAMGLADVWCAEDEAFLSDLHSVMAASNSIKTKEDVGIGPLGDAVVHPGKSNDDIDVDAGVLWLNAREIAKKAPKPEKPSTEAASSAAAGDGADAASKRRRELAKIAAARWREGAKERYAIVIAKSIDAASVKAGAAVNRTGNLSLLYGPGIPTEGQCEDNIYVHKVHWIDQHARKARVVVLDEAQKVGNLCKLVMRFKCFPEPFSNICSDPFFDLLCMWRGIRIRAQLIDLIDGRSLSDCPFQFVDSVKSFRIVSWFANFWRRQVKCSTEAFHKKTVFDKHKIICSDVGVPMAKLIRFDFPRDCLTYIGMWEAVTAIEDDAGDSLAVSPCAVCNGARISEEIYYCPLCNCCWHTACVEDLGDLIKEEVAKSLRTIMVPDFKWIAAKKVCKWLKSEKVLCAQCSLLTTSQDSR